ncbi:MAG TPA: ATP-binding protein, partial [Burkholderiaceae bacterium]
PGEWRRLRMVLKRHHRIAYMPLLLTTHDNRQGWVEVSAHVISGPNGAADTRIEGMVSDISQRRAAEQELARHRADLEELVAERTAELSEAKLRAEAASQSKSRFLATMSHEFRTPLNAILGFAQLLQLDAGLAEQHRHRVGMIRDSGEHLLGLIKDVLDMASIEAGRVRITPEVVDLRGLLDVITDSMRLRAEEKQLEFRVELHDELPSKVRVDGQRLRQVLLNLLANAVRFTDQGFVSLKVWPLARTTSQLRVRFEVADSGIGISANHLDRLFQPFEQVVEGGRRQGGTGLGLSISQQLVKLMDGQITVQSEAGRGSCFSFELDLMTG